MNASVILLIGGKNLTLLILCAIVAIYLVGEKKWGWFSICLALAVANAVAIYFRLLAQ